MMLYIWVQEVKARIYMEILQICNCWKSCSYEYINKNFQKIKVFLCSNAFIDTKKYQPVANRAEGKVRIGWSGSHHTIFMLYLY